MPALRLRSGQAPAGIQDLLLLRVNANEIRSKLDCMRLAHQDCHPEPFDDAQDKLREGSRREILRFAQNDTPDGVTL